jgi:hypothetical protein
MWPLNCYVDMNHLLITITVIFLTSCTGREVSETWGELKNVRVTFDTLVVDAAGEVLYLNDGLVGSDLTIGSDFLYNFNPFDHTLEKISLDKLRLEDKLPFDREGPNGTGQITSGIQIQNENQVVIQRYLFSLEGKKLKTIDLTGFKLGWEYREIPSSKPILNPNATKLYLLTKKIENDSILFGIFDLESTNSTRHPLPSFEDIKKSTFTLWIKGSSFVLGPRVSLDRFGTKVVMSNQVTNTLTVYDTFLDSLYVKTYDSRITANKKTNEYKLEHESEERLNTEYARFHEEINFLPPFWDEEKQLFYRFSYVQLPSMTDDPEDVKSTIYLSAFDKDLNLVGEMVVPQLSKPPETIFSNPFPKHFAKDGKIWIYENLNDEMGFVVLTLNR